jgi:hypothetical protein
MSVFVVTGRGPVHVTPMFLDRKTRPCMPTMATMLVPGVAYVCVKVTKK